MQMIIYEKDTERVMCRGYVNWNINRIEIDSFIVDGEYTIKVNGEILRNIKNRDQDGFRSDKQYFLSSSNRIYTKSITVNITDEILGTSRTWRFKPYTHVDFIRLINDLEFNEEN